MKSFRTPFLVLCLTLLLQVCLAQQPPPTQPPVASSVTSPLTFTQQIRGAVAFLTVAYQDGSTPKGAIGTCFFVSVLDKRLGENQAFVYLVTNRHVAQPGIDLHTPYPVLGAFLRLNLVSPQGEIQSVQEQIPLGTQLHWYFPRDDSVDLAILPLAPPSNRYAYVQIPSSMIATSEKVKAGDVVVGDRVTFTGYFSNFPGQKRIEPIVRQGVIAMLPDENLDTTLHKPGRLYLADLHAFHGNSGSPVFVDVGGAHHGAFVLGENYLLLGVVSGYYPESVGFSVPAATILTGEVRDNSGIATIVPADDLNKLLNSTEVQTERDRQVSILRKKP
jgi:hypothetical protein